MNKLDTYLADKDADYIKNCWEEFLKLTEQEIENLKQMALCRLRKKLPEKRKYRRGKRVICAETGEIFKNASQAADYFGASRSRLWQCLQYGWKLYRKYTFKYTNKEQERKKILWITV